MFDKRQFEKMMWQFNADKDKLSIQMNKLSKQLYDLENQKKKLQSDLIISSDILSTREWEFDRCIESNGKYYKHHLIENAIVLKVVIDMHSNGIRDWSDLSCIIGIHHTLPYCIELNKKVTLIVGSKCVYLAIDYKMFNHYVKDLNIKIDTVLLDLKMGRLLSDISRKVKKSERNIKILKLLKPQSIITASSG